MVSFPKGIVRWLVKTLVFLLLATVCLILAAGRPDWQAGWIYIGLLVFVQALTFIVLVSVSPDLIVERSKVREGSKSWDRLLAGVVAIIGPLSMWIVAGLDVRGGWSPPIPPGLQAAGLAVALLGSAFTLWAMAVNRFFSGTVRIQDDRGHAVIDRGPYRYIRHPGYLGGIVFDLATPLALDGLWAYVPVVLIIAVLVIRTALEDRTLNNELAGYSEYARRVRYRLFPGIW